MSLLLKYYNMIFGFEQWQKLSNPDVYLLRYVHNEFQIEVFGKVNLERKEGLTSKN